MGKSPKFSRFLIMTPPLTFVYDFEWKISIFFIFKIIQGHKKWNIYLTTSRLFMQFDTYYADKIVMKYQKIIDEDMCTNAFTRVDIVRGFFSCMGTFTPCLTLTM